MAYQNIKEERVGSIPKNDRGDFIVVTRCVNERTKEVSVDIRTFYTPKDTEEIAPTQRGIRLSDEHMAELIEYIYNATSVEGKEEIKDRMKAIIETEIE